MARTRLETQADVILNTGRSDKASYIDRQCDNALKIACTKHTFNDSLHLADDLTLTESTTSVSISSLEESSVALGTTIDIITARIVQADGSMNRILTLKNRQWWDREVINPEDNGQGWPIFGLKFGSNMIFNRPVDSGLELRLRVQTIPTYAGDSTECPIELLDTFIEQYVTALTYLSVGMMDKYVSWYIMAIGRDYDKRGIPGGALLAAINKDRTLAGESKNVERRENVTRDNGIAVLNNTQGDPNFGNFANWY